MTILIDKYTSSNIQSYIGLLRTAESPSTLEVNSNSGTIQRKEKVSAKRLLDVTWAYHATKEKPFGSAHARDVFQRASDNILASLKEGKLFVNFSSVAVWYSDV